MSIFAAQDIAMNFGGIRAVEGVSFAVEPGEVFSIIGPNGAGKTTIFNMISRIYTPSAGKLIFNGEDITQLETFDIIRRGIAQSPEGRRVFPRMTVFENLQMGATVVDPAWFKADLEKMFTLFPRLRERREQRAGTLSGGEQQMLAIARALMSRPTLLLLDEPSLGLAPLVVKQIFAAIRDINSSQGMTVLLVEQNAHHALKLAHRGYVMQTGRIVLSGTGAELLANPEVRAAYLEGAH